MKGLIWNCRGIKRKGVSSFLRDLILEHKFHFISIQETMQEDIEDSLIRLIDPNQSYLWKWIPSRGRSGGILSGINNEMMDVGALSEGKYMLQLNLWDKMAKRKWNFINIYGAAQEENKREFLTELANFCGNNQDPVIIGGDFNIIRFSLEKNKGGTHRYSGLFNSIIDAYELIDIHMKGGKYTWPNNQNPPTLERLDRFLISKNWEDLFPTAFVYKLPREISDHNPLIISSSLNQPIKNLTFRFELSWVKHPDFLSKVKELWDKPCHANSAFDRIQAKIKRFKQYFKG